MYVPLESVVKAVLMLWWNEGYESSKAYVSNKARESSKAMKVVKAM